MTVFCPIVRFSRESNCVNCQIKLIIFISAVYRTLLQSLNVITAFFQREKTFFILSSRQKKIKNKVLVG